MSRVKQTLQRIVLTVNRLPFGLYLTRLPYYMAVRAVARLLKRYPPVSAAYVRNSFALGLWVPGRSDIDLTLILGAGEPLRSELNTVRGFWKDYAALQRWFPMLGEVEILSEGHLEAWTRYSITGYEARYWLRIYGKDLDRSGYAGGEDQQHCDRLDHAISIYRYQMVPVIGSARQEILVRYAKKILRYLDTQAYTDEELAALSREALQATVVQELDRGVREHAGSPAGDVALNLERTLGRTEPAAVQHGTAPASLTRAGPAGELLESVVVSPYDPDRIYFITGEPLDNERLMGCITAANDGRGTPVVMSQALFIHYLQFIDPLEHLALLQTRTLLWGSDPFDPALPWSEKVFHNAVCAYSAHILSFPYSQDLERKSGNAFRDLLLGWVLRTARYYEDRVMDFDYDRLLEYWQRVHPENGIANWQRDPDDLVQRFTLLRSLTDCICSGMLRESDSRNTRTSETCDG